MTIVVGTISSSSSKGMTFLQLVQRLRRKTRTSGSNPATVTGVLPEETARLVDWINEAWVDLQVMRQDWLWMRTNFSFVTTLNQATYTITQIGLTDFGNWADQTFRNYPTAIGNTAEIPMDVIDYEGWRNTYQLGATRVSASRPNQFTITPNFSIGLGPVPVAGYTVTGDYFKVPSEMAIDTDIPGISTQYHMIIVYRAMMYYGVSEGASEVYQEGKEEYTKMIKRMTLQQLADFSLPGGLA